VSKSTQLHYSKQRITRGSSLWEVLLYYVGGRCPVRPGAV